MEEDMKKLILKYNHQDTLLMISLYPKKRELYSPGTSGVASYAKNITTHLKRKVVVLADFRDKEELYEENGVLVIRCFRKNTPLMWVNIFKNILKFSAVRNVLIQFDFAVYGGPLTTSTILFLLSVLRVLGYEVSVVMHHVVLDVFKLKGHLGLGNAILDKIKGYAYNIFFHLFYKIIGHLTSKIIVLEDALKNKLVSVISKDKLVTIPHGVDTEIEAKTKESARQLLGIGRDEYVVLFFGFVNWFKGADFFVEAFKDVEKVLGKKARFIIAGGESPTMSSRQFYRNYFDEVNKKIEESKEIDITGYIPQRKIPVYFSSADLIVLPYRHFMTASGVLSLVFSYRKPFIISDEFKEMFHSSDFQEALAISGLNQGDVMFKLNKNSCVEAAKNVLVNGLKDKMVDMTGYLREKRAYQKTAILFDKTLFSRPLYTLHKPLKFGYTQN